MKIIVGLGNPDVKYSNTYHNLGFMCADCAAELLGAQFGKEKCRALVAETKIGGEKVILAKPLTYMNLSGESVSELLGFFKAEAKDLLVIYDDFDIGVGTLRIRESGSAGTHNGMRNIVEKINTTLFPRIRIGFKPEAETRVPLLDYVLSAIKEEDKKPLSLAISSAAKAAEEFARGEKIGDIMQRYNGKAQ